MERLLECRGLRKRFGDRVAVGDLTFGIDRGETYGLLGPNGAGKTTAISMVCGLLERDAGEVLLGGEPVTPTAVAAKARIGLVPQDVALYEDLSARENLLFFGRLQGLSGRALTTRVEETLELIGLAERAGDRVSEYSGGMKRRANIGAGLLHRPDLLILDEPTVGVDPQSRNAILDSIEALSGEGLSVLYTTHYMEEAERLCDRVGILDEGVLVAEGTRRELVARIGERDRIRVAGSGPVATLAALAPQRIDGATAEAADGAVELLVPDARHALATVVAAAADAGVQVASLEIVEPDLEAVFLHLTGKALRD